MRRALLLAPLLTLLAGCADEIDRNARKAAPLTPEQQIEKIRNTPGMPEDVKARTIAGLEQQAAAKAANAAPR